MRQQRIQRRPRRRAEPTETAPLRPGGAGDGEADAVEALLDRIDDLLATPQRQA